MLLIILSLVFNFAARSSSFSFAHLLLNLTALVVLLVSTIDNSFFRNILLAGAASLFSLCLAEAVFAILFGRNSVYEGTYGSKDYYAMSDVLGSEPKPGVFRSRKCLENCESGKTIYDVTYTIQQGALRYTPQDNIGKKTALFFGCSYTFGEGLNDNETLPYYFEKVLPHYKVFNVGFHGYGAHQMLRALETGIHDKKIGDHVDLIVFQTAPWHADRSYCMPDYSTGTPKYVLIDDVPVYSGTCGRLNTAYKLVRKSQIYNYFLNHVQPALVDNENKFRLYLAIMLKTQNIARQKYGARFLVAFIRGSKSEFYGSSYTNEKILKFFVDNDIEFLDVSLFEDPGKVEAEYEIGGDGHPSAFAQRERARLLAAAVSGQ
jgi:hypothetical protein